jgi:hypothetical protein
MCCGLAKSVSGSTMIFSAGNRRIPKLIGLSPIWIDRAGMPLAAHSAQLGGWAEISSASLLISLMNICPILGSRLIDSA